MKICFIYPPIPYAFAKTPYPPLGIGYLSAVIAERCSFVTERKLIDGQIEEENVFWEQLAQAKADVFLISATLRQIKATKKAARVIKQENPQALTVVGGAGPSCLRIHNPQFISGTAIDIAVCGEGEDTVPLILEKAGRLDELKTIPKLLINTKNAVIQTPLTELKPDIKKLPWPDRSIFSMERYLKRWQKSAGMTSVHLIGSRGCPYRCAFCDHTVTGRKVRYRKPADVVDEMLHLYKTHSPDDIFYFDDTFTLSGRRVAAICALLHQAEKNVTWSAQGRVDCVDRSMLEAMKIAGCTELYFGVESGSNRILKHLGKGFTAEQVKEAFALCHSVGIKPGAYLIVGVPGETREDIEQTADLIEEIEPFLVNYSVLTPFPNTPLYRKTKADIDQWDYESWDDFGTESVYKEDTLSIHPAEARRIIEERYRKIIDSGMEHSSYQFAND